MAKEIFRAEKVKGHTGGIEKEHNRDKSMEGMFEASDIDWSRTDRNKYLMRTDNWSKVRKKILAEHGITKWRKDAVTSTDIFFTATPTWFEEHPDKVEEYFRQCIEFAQRHYGVVYNAVIHYDESSPHIHVNTVPLVQTENGWKLSAKEIFGNRSQMSAMQTAFHEEVGRHFGLERGTIREAGEVAKHISHSVHKKKMLDEEIAKKKSEASRLDEVIGENKAVLHKQTDVMRENNHYLEEIDEARKVVEQAEVDKKLFDDKMRQILAYEPKKRLFSKEKVELSEEEYKALKEGSTLYKEALQIRQQTINHAFEVKRYMDEADAMMKSARKEKAEAKEMLAHAKEHIAKEAESRAIELIGTLPKDVKNRYDATLKVLDEYSIGGKPLKEEIVRKAQELMVKEMKKMRERNRGLSR